MEARDKTIIDKMKGTIYNEENLANGNVASFRYL